MVAVVEIPIDLKLSRNASKLVGLLSTVSDWILPIFNVWIQFVFSQRKLGLAMPSSIVGTSIQSKASAKSSFTAAVKGTETILRLKVSVRRSVNKSL